MTGAKDINADENRNTCYRYDKSLRTAAPQILATCVKNLLLLGYGMTLGFSTVLIPAVSEPRDGEVLALNKNQISWIGSINLIMVPLGCAVSGVLTQPIGRRRSMQLINIPFFVAWLMFSFSRSFAELCIALILTGLGGGILEAPVLTYVSEITQPHLRGALSATSSMCIIIGVFTQFLLGNFLYWRTIALVNIAFTVLAIVALFFVPESPYWLVSKCRFDEARQSLQWLRGWTTPDMVEEELKDIQIAMKIKSGDVNKTKEPFKEVVSHYLKKSFLIPYLLVSYAFFVGHFSGMSTLQTYAVFLFGELESPIDKYNATLILGIIQIVGSGVCVGLVHYTGKRPLTLVSTIGAGICCFIISSYSYYIRSMENNSLSDSLNGTITDTAPRENELSWLPTTVLLLLAFLTHTGIRLLPWILIGEVFSMQTRSGASGFASGTGYIFGFLSNKLFLSMVDVMDIYGIYLMYGIISVSGAIVLHFILPETEGKQLRDIENHFSGIKRLTNEVYRSKKMSKLRPEKHLVGVSNVTFEMETVPEGIENNNVNGRSH